MDCQVTGLSQMGAAHHILALLATFGGSQRKEGGPDAACGGIWPSFLSLRSTLRWLSAASGSPDQVAVAIPFSAKHAALSQRGEWQSRSGGCSNSFLCEARCAEPAGEMPLLYVPARFSVKCAAPRQ